MNNKEKVMLTKEGVQERKKRLTFLVETERPKIIEEIKVAREQGDLSENAEFDAAREKQGQIEDEILELEAILSEAQIIKSSSSDKVTVGSKVVFEDKRKKQVKTIIIVGTLEADPFAEDNGVPLPRISNESPIAIALLGHSKGDEVRVKASKTYNVVIKDIIR